VTSHGSPIGLLQFDRLEAALAARLVFCPRGIFNHRCAVTALPQPSQSSAQFLFPQLCPSKMPHERVRWKANPIVYVQVKTPLSSELMLRLDCPDSSPIKANGRRGLARMQGVSANRLSSTSSKPCARVLSSKTENPRSSGARSSDKRNFDTYRLIRQMPTQNPGSILRLGCRQTTSNERPV